QGAQPIPSGLGGPGEMVNPVEDAGFHEKKEVRKTHTMAFKDEDEHIDVFVEGRPLGHSIREEDPPVQTKILSRTRENLRRWRTRKGIEIPCECVIVTAHK